MKLIKLKGLHSTVGRALSPPYGGVLIQGEPRDGSGGGDASPSQECQVLLAITRGQEEAKEGFFLSAIKENKAMPTS